MKSRHLIFRQARFRAALAVRGLTLHKLADRCAVTASHLGRVVDGERVPSRTLIDAMRRELGDGWGFAVGEVDSLHDLGRER
jgi:transcriptional regulator with XRE-family HTH domain